MDQSHSSSEARDIGHLFRIVGDLYLLGVKPNQDNTPPAQGKPLHIKGGETVFSWTSGGLI